MTALRAPVPDSAPLPLYLRARTATRVEAAGPALRVARQGKAVVAYPLARISRVIADQKVAFSAAALAACMQARIPLVLVDGGGCPVGFVQPAQVAPSRLDGLLREFVDLPDWRTRYGNWLRARRMSLVCDWEQAQVALGREVTAQTHAEKVRLWVQPEGNVHVLSAWSLFEGALASHVSKRVLQGGLEPRYWALDGVVLDLRADLVGLIELSLSLEMAGLGAAMHGQAEALLQVLQQLGPGLQDQVDAHLARLHRFLREALESWR